MIVNISLKVSLENKTTQTIKTADLTVEYIDFRDYFIATDLLLMMDCFLYMLYIVLMVNVIIALLPDLFSSLVAFFGRFISKQVMILFFISVFLLVISSFMRMCMLGPLVYGMENLFYALTRNLM